MSLSKYSVKWEYLWYGILLLTALVVLFSPDHLRGSDQYWYTADASAVAHGFHATTNDVFPNSFDGNWEAAERPFVHNRPIVYLVGFVGVLTHNVLFSWRIVNLLLLILTVMLVRSGIGFLLKDHFPPDQVKGVAILGGITYLLMPFNFWLVFQQLSSLADSFLAALIFLYIFPRWITRQKSEWFWWLIVLIAALLFVFGRKDQLLMLILGLLLWLWARKQLMSRYVLFIPLLLVAVFVVKPLFPGHLIVKFPFYRLILESRPGVSDNMVSFMNPHIGQYNFTQLMAILIPKALYNFKLQWWPQRKLLPFYYSFNLLLFVVIGGVLAVKKIKINSHIRAYAFLSFGMLISYFIIILVYQNHYRYMVTVLPILTVVAFSIGKYAYAHLLARRTLIRSVLLSATSILLCLDISLAIIGLRQARAEEQQANILGKKLSSYANPQMPLLSEWTSHAQIIGYMHRPGKCLYVDKAYILEHPELLKQPQVNWIVTAKNSALDSLIQNSSSQRFPLSEGFVLSKLK